MTEHIAYDELFKALGNEQRLKIVYLLYCVDNKVTVSEFAYVFEDSQSNASRQLKILKECGLLKRERDGKWTYYSIVDDVDEFTREVLECVAKIPRDFVRREIDRCNELIAQRGGTPLE